MPARPLPFNEIADRLRQRPITDSAAHRWDEEIRRAGLDTQPSKVMNRGVPLLAIGVLTIALVLAIFEPRDGIRPFGILLILLAIAPWGFWLFKGDEGPHWQPIVVFLLPIALLGAGHWFLPVMGPGSDIAYPALAFPPLLLTILAVAIAPARLAAGIVIAAWAVVGIPLLAALAAGKDVTGTEIVTWHVAVALCITAGYAIRFSNKANAAVAVAREAQVRQEASERQRQVARDVHDVVAHTLAVTMLHITAARMAVGRKDLATAAQALEEAERHGRESMTDIRAMVRILRGDAAADRAAAQPGYEDLDTLITSWEASGLDVTASVRLDPGDLTPAAHAVLYRILQEALTNAARHGSGPVSIEVSPEVDHVCLFVANPLPPGHTVSGYGSGVTGMRERASAVDGELTAGVENDRWLVRAHLPRREHA
ncbi:MAG TPA: histidine kinase [Thermomicrobiales bacterium]|nr:histidine kinase [Thermomicrobiales bacterium]